MYFEDTLLARLHGWWYALSIVLPEIFQAFPFIDGTTFDYLVEICPPNLPLFWKLFLCNIYLKVLVTILIFTSFHPTILSQLMNDPCLSQLLPWSHKVVLIRLAIPPFLLHLLAEILSKRNSLHTHFNVVLFLYPGWNVPLDLSSTA